MFLVLFWILRMLVTVHKPCHVSHASQITTLGTTFTEVFFDVSKEWVRSWSYLFLKTNLKTYTKKLLAVRPEKRTRRKKRKKTRIATTKLFAFNVNAIIQKWFYLNFVLLFTNVLLFCYKGNKMTMLKQLLDFLLSELKKIFFFPKCRPQKKLFSRLTDCIFYAVLLVDQ